MPSQRCASRCFASTSPIDDETAESAGGMFATSSFMRCAVSIASFAVSERRSYATAESRSLNPCMIPFPIDFASSNPAFTSSGVFASVFPISIAIVEMTFGIAFSAPFPIFSMTSGSFVNSLSASFGKFFAAKSKIFVNAFPTYGAAFPPAFSIFSKMRSNSLSRRFSISSADAFPDAKSCMIDVASSSSSLNSRKMFAPMRFFKTSAALLMRSN